MHRSIASAATAVVLAAALVGGGGSDGDGSKAGSTKSASSSGAASGGQQTPDVTPSSTTPSGAKVGDTLSLEGVPGMGATGHVQADVTLTKYEDNAKPSLEAFAAPDGQRLVAAKFTILSTGDATYDDPGNFGGKVIDSTGKVYTGKPGSPTAGESLDLTLILQPGDKATGWVIFNVPQDAKIAAVTYQMDSLLQTNGEHTDRWTLAA
ncbi:hypothetical protein [Streptomyces sp. NBC_00009]|uniref:hypothetical protein n=1 Tax=Streptomyces sp. NBC_00009 TaxID=2975620 RepID=UPI0032449973